MARRFGSPRAFPICATSTSVIFPIVNKTRQAGFGGGRDNSESIYFDAHLSTYRALEHVKMERDQDVDCSTCAKPALHLHCSFDPDPGSGLHLDCHNTHGYLSQY